MPDLEGRALDRELDCVRSSVISSVSSPMGEGSHAVAGCWVVWGQLVHQAVLGEALGGRLALEGTPS